MVKSFFSENRVVYKIMRRNILEKGRPQMSIWLMRFAYWVTEGTDTHRVCNIYYFLTATMITERA